MNEPLDGTLPEDALADPMNFNVTEQVVLEKFEGEAAPENLIERVYITDGVITQRDYVENGTVVQTIVEGGDSNTIN